MSSEDPNAPVDDTNAPATSVTRQAVREKALKVHAKQSRARILRRSALGLGAVAAVAVVAVAVTYAVTSTLDRPQLSPTSADRDGFAVTDITATSGAPVAGDDAVGDDAAATEGTLEPNPTASTAPPVAIQVYVDYLSPGARDWQLANASQLTSWVDEGAVTLSFHPVSMLTAKSNGTKYSLRAASAAACVATQSPASFFSFHNDLLDKQPTVDSDGLSDSDLADLAIAAGAEDPKKIRACIEDEAYAAWVRGATERAIAGIEGTDLALTGTPMVIVNGQQYVGDLTDPAEFSQFVLTNASGAFHKSQAETPTPTPTPAG